MTQENQILIKAKIDELKDIAKKTNSPLFLVMQENDEKNGRHICAYGNGIQIRDLLQQTVNHYPDVKEIVQQIKTL